MKRGGGGGGGEMWGKFTVPGVVVQGVDVSVGDRLVETREDGLAADDAPGCFALGGRNQLVVEPVLLTATHHGTGCIVGDGVDVVGVVVEIGDTSVVLAGIEHDKVEERTDREGSPDAQVVVQLNLPNGHPFEVGSHGIHLALIDTDSTVFDERGFGVVEIGLSISICVIGDLVVIPDGDPGVLRVAEDQIEIGAISGNPLTVVVESINGTIWQGNPLNGLSVSIITVLHTQKLDYSSILDLVLHYTLYS